MKEEKNHKIKINIKSRSIKKERMNEKNKKQQEREYHNSFVPDQYSNNISFVCSMP